VWSKFLFSFLGGLLPCAALVLLSDSMLGLPWPLIALHEYCCLLLCLGLSGIAVGLGARMPELRESSPSKIASGFGGTLCLVLSSLYIMVVVIAAAIPTHLFLLVRTLGPTVIAADGLLAWAGGPMGSAASIVFATMTGLAATAVPLALGLAAFRRLEA
jgi:ABC-2 type transport system permease protein